MESVTEDEDTAEDDVKFQLSQYVMNIMLSDVVLERT